MLMRWLAIALLISGWMNFYQSIQEGRRKTADVWTAVFGLYGAVCFVWAIIELLNGK